MDWQNERYVRFYVRDTPDLLAIGDAATQWAQRWGSMVEDVKTATIKSARDQCFADHRDELEIWVASLRTKRGWR